jgi:hypothetical protein
MLTQLTQSTQLTQPTKIIMRFIYFMVLMTGIGFSQSPENSIRKEILLQSRGFIVFENGVEQPLQTTLFSAKALRKLLSEKAILKPHLNEMKKSRAWIWGGLGAIIGGTTLGLTGIQLRSTQGQEIGDKVAYTGAGVIAIGFASALVGAVDQNNTTRKAIFVYNLNP